MSCAKKHTKMAFDRARRPENAEYGRPTGPRPRPAYAAPNSNGYVPGTTQIYGRAVAPRVKWSCKCGQRNDHALPLSIEREQHEPFVCVRCRRISVLTFKRNEPVKGAA